MTQSQRVDLAELLDVYYANRSFGNHKAYLVNHYESKTFDYMQPVQIRNINAKLAIKLWKLL